MGKNSYFGDTSFMKDVIGVEYILKPYCDLSDKKLIFSDKEALMLEVIEEIRKCRKCPLSRERTNVVPGEGNLNAELMFVGEGPGADEDLKGRPFVGKAGQLLTKMIEAMGYRREEVYIANIVKCRPPNNRAPFDEEAFACLDYLKRQINIVNPKVIVCLGATSVKYLLNVDKKISSLRGEFVDFDGIKVMPTFHPSYLLRNQSMKKLAWEDLKKVIAILK